MTPLGVALVGAGYWGPKLARNLQASPDFDLRWVCDLSEERARAMVGSTPEVRVTDALDEVLNDRDVAAVAVATPPHTHFPLGLACLEAGRHLLLEKPLASSVAEGEKLTALAAERGVTLMCDHTYCYTPAARKLRSLVRSGELGDVQYVDSVRINLGLVQSDVDVFWDLAPHDLSILDFVLPDGAEAQRVAAQGSDPIGAGSTCVGYLTVQFDGGLMAHVHVNWLSPTKIRTTILGGSRQIAVWDDLNPSQRLSLYDKGVDLTGELSPGTRHDALVSYRLGDMVAPALPETEALGGVVREFASAIREQRAPLTDGEAGLRVLRILDAIPRSLERDGAAVPLSGGASGSG